MGYGLIRFEQQKPQLLDLGVLKPGQIKDPYKRLQLIFNTVSGLITRFAPTDFAIEAPFFGKNVQSMLKLGRAQGVAIAAAMRHGLDVTEYSPKKVKQMVTGNGNASKEQVMKMLQTQLQFKESPTQFDATDALAVALCHYYHNRIPLPVATDVPKKLPARARNSKNSWQDFIEKNPGRIAKK